MVAAARGCNDELWALGEQDFATRKRACGEHGQTSGAGIADHHAHVNAHDVRT